MRLLSPVLDDNTTAVNDLVHRSALCPAYFESIAYLASISLTVKNTETSPFSQLLSVRNLDQRDLVLRAKRNDQLLVCLLLAALVEYANVSLTSVQGLGCFAETSRKTVVHKSKLENTLESIENALISKSVSFPVQISNFRIATHHGS